MPPTDTIRVAIIDDNRLVREALTAMLNRLTDIRVVSSDVADSASLAETKPDVLLLDVGLRDQDSLRVAATLRQENPDAKIIVMDLLPVNEEIMEYVNAGCPGSSSRMPRSTSSSGRSGRSPRARRCCPPA